MNFPSAQLVQFGASLARRSYIIDERRSPKKVINKRKKDARAIEVTHKETPMNSARLIVHSYLCPGVVQSINSASLVFRERTRFFRASREPLARAGASRGHSFSLTVLNVIMYMDRVSSPPITRICNNLHEILGRPRNSPPSRT